MEHIPRYTEFFQKRAKLRLQDIQDACKDPEIHEAWEVTRAALHVMLSRARELPFPLTREQDEALWAHSAPDRATYNNRLTQLSLLLRQRAPKVALVWGEYLRTFFVGKWFHAQGLESPPGLKRQEAFSPDNPIRRLAANIYYIPEDINSYIDARHRHQCLLELDGYFVALQPANPPGRPKKSLSTNPPQPPNRLDPQLAVRAATMKRDGNHWLTIAKILLPPFKTSESEKIRSKVNRLVDRGNILLKKS